MADEKKPNQQPSNPLVGRQAVPTTLDNTTTLDIDTNKILVDNIIEAGLSHQLDISALENFTSISNSRAEIYQLIDTMAQDSSVASILRTYAEDVCETADNGHVIWCESNDPKVSLFINYILNVMNADKNMFSWVYALLKYGDVYLRMFRESDYTDEFFNTDKINNAFNAKTPLREDLNVEPDDKPKENLDEAVHLNVHAANDPYSYYVEMVDDPSTMFELTKFGKTYGYIEVPNAPDNLGYSPMESFTGVTPGTFNFRMKDTDVNIFQADDFVHACLEDNLSRFPETVELFTNNQDMNTGKKGRPYSVRRGKSLLYDSYKIWREKALLESAALLNRITRSSVVRKVAVEVGDMPKEQVQLTLRRVKDMMEQKASINTGKSMGEYNNPGPMENNIYFATHNGQGNITIDSVGGDVEVKNLADLDWWNNKFYSSYGIPKQYFGWTDDGAGFNGGTSLTILSSVYAKGVKRVQNAMIQAITDCINLILINKGLKSYLNNFTLKMKAPITQEELDYRNDLTNRISAISNLQSLFTDVEDRARRLRILKTLVATLNYGSEMIAEIDAEIEETEEAAKAEADAAEGSEGSAPVETETAPAEAGAGNEEDTDLGNLAALEDWERPEEGQALLEDDEFSGANVLIEEDELPSPAELDSDKDFTENN